MFPKNGECLHFHGLLELLVNSQNCECKSANIIFSLGCQIHLHLSPCVGKQENTVAWGRKEMLETQACYHSLPSSLFRRVSLNPKTMDISAPLERDCCALLKRLSELLR